MANVLRLIFLDELSTGSMNQHFHNLPLLHSLCKLNLGWHIPISSFVVWASLHLTHLDVRIDMI
jgi:hypothetical protein